MINWCKWGCHMAYRGHKSLSPPGPPSNSELRMLGLGLRANVDRLYEKAIQGFNNIGFRDLGFCVLGRGSSSTLGMCPW